MSLSIIAALQPGQPQHWLEAARSLPGNLVDRLEWIAVGPAEALPTEDVPALHRLTARPQARRAELWNQGARAAQFDRCLFVDGSDHLSAETLARHARLGAEGPAGLEPVRHPLESSQPGHLPTAVGLAGALLSFARTAFLADTGFEADYPRREEADLILRWLANGFPVEVLPAGTVRSWLSADPVQLGAADAALLRHHPQFAHWLPLGRFHDLGLRGLLLRRFLLGPVRFLASWISRWDGSWFQLQLGYWRGVQRSLDKDLWNRLVNSPIILMYHAIGLAGEAASQYVLPVGQFARQMDWLRRAGYQVISLEKLLNDRRAGQLPPARSVVITFDDGYRDNWTLAGPVLARFNFPATVFLVASAIGHTNRWDRTGQLRGRAILNGVDLAAMSASPMRIGYHGYHHHPVTGLDTATLQADLDRSTETLRERLVEPVPVLAYPHGEYSVENFLGVRSAGLVGACCSEPGPCDPVVPNLALRRLEIRGDAGLLDFVLALRLGKTRVIRRLWEGR